MQSTDGMASFLELPVNSNTCAVLENMLLDLNFDAGSAFVIMFPFCFWMYIATGSC
jgi:hypothetical protein